MDDITHYLALFAPLFSARVWCHAQLLLIGALLAPGKRTVTSILRVLGRSQEAQYTNFHRVLNRARWSTRQGSRLLLGVLVSTFLPPGQALVIGADDTVERRRGKQITQVGCYRDGVRSSRNHVIRCFGLKWVSMQVLVRVPWSDRVWALPFMTVLCAPAPKPKIPSKKVRRTQGTHPYREASGHKTSIDWIRQMIKQVRRWLPTPPLVLVVDGGLAAQGLGRACVGIGTTLVSRLRWDAALYHPPKKRAPGQRGPTAHKGARQRRLAVWAQRADTPWVSAEIDWYGGQKKTMLVCAHNAWWYTPGWTPLPIRWVMVRDPEGKLRDEVFFATDLHADPVQVVNWVVMRWSVEVTFEEARAHLGMESQRQWSDLAIERTTPVLLGLYAIVTWLTAQQVQHQTIPIQRTAWYKKEKATFSDCLLMIRKHLWKTQLQHPVISSEKPDIIQLNADILQCLLEVGYLQAA